MDLSGFDALPMYEKKTLVRLAIACELYLCGIILSDDRNKLDRDDWEDAQRTEFGDDFNVVNGWSKLRGNIMSKITNPLGSIADSMANGVNKDGRRNIFPAWRTGGSQSLDNTNHNYVALYAIYAKCPNITPPFKKAVYSPELGMT